MRALLAALAIATPAAAQMHMLKDIHPGPNHSRPFSFAILGDLLYMAADDGISVHNHEIWVTDGTAERTRQFIDINPTGSSFPRFLMVVNDRLFFVASTVDTGTELWISDGTISGTRMVKDIRPGGVGSIVEAMTDVNGTLFFAASDGTLGFELWKSDGTESGTLLVKDINSLGSSSPGELTNVNGVLFFAADDGVHGEELWKSDGTEAGTTMVTDLLSGALGSIPHELTELAGLLYFTTFANPSELWVSDGTEPGTVQVVEIPDVHPPGSFFVTGESMYFESSDGLWITDGTEAGTELLMDLVFHHGADFIGLGNKVFFRADDRIHGFELWMTDGSIAGTVLLKDFWPGPSDSDPSNLGVHDGHLYFRTNDGIHGTELWRTDGTEDGTELVFDINPSGDSLPEALASINGYLVVTADDGTHGWELWASTTSIAAPAIRPRWLVLLALSIVAASAVRMKSPIARTSRPGRNI